jgi:hypothetical protein
MTYIAHPSNKEQEKAIKAFFEALEVPYEIQTGKDETEHLLSTEENTKRLEEAMEDERQGKGTKISLDDIWK